MLARISSNNRTVIRLYILYQQKKIGKRKRRQLTTHRIDARLVARCRSSSMILRTRCHWIVSFS